MRIKGKYLAKIKGEGNFDLIKGPYRTEDEVVAASRLYRAANTRANHTTLCMVTIESVPRRDVELSNGKLVK